MLVHDLVEAKEFFVGEMKQNYYVIYEKFENTDAVLSGRTVEEKKIGIEEVVQIFKGDEQSNSLRKLSSYRIGTEFQTIEEILAKVKLTHREIFV